MNDRFKVRVEIEPPSYVYVFLIEPNGEFSPLYPWKADPGWGSRPASEKQVARMLLPDANDFKLLNELSGVTTLVAFARPNPLPHPDGEIQAWFKDLPRIIRPKNDPRPVVWCDDYAPVRSDQKRAIQLVSPIDPYERWQVELKKRVGAAAAFETSVSFAQGRD
jgi:hypothetical protein